MARPPAVGRPAGMQAAAHGGHPQPVARAQGPALTVHRRLLLLAAGAVLLPLAALAAVLGEWAAGGVSAGWWVALVTAAVLLSSIAVLILRLARQIDEYVSQLERSRREFRIALSRLGDALEAAGDRRALLEVVLETTQAMAGADAVVFWADAGSHLVARVARGDAGVVGRRIEKGVGAAGRAAAADAAVRWPPGDGPDAAEPAARTALAVPLHAGGRLFGVLGVYGHGREGSFSDDDLSDVRDLARQASTAVDRTFLHEESRRLSLTDGLTGVWNRRQLDLRLSQELERAARFGEQFSVVMCDIDGFKPINDTHGHQVGDAVLVEVARRCVDCTREVDLVARYGGEEFALVLPQTDLQGGIRVAEKVRAAVAAEPFDVDDGPIRVTVSLGVSCHPLHGSSVGSLLGAADEALYEAKRSGKNRVCHAVAEPVQGESR